MSNTKLIFSILFAAILGGLVSVGTYKVLAPAPTATQNETVAFQTKYNNTNEVEELAKNFTVPAGLNFVTAAKKVTPAVVHIKTLVSAPQASRGNQRYNDFFREFFGEQVPQGHRMASGSGVIVSADGYIATNNHVIEDAEEIEVVLDDKRSFKAELVGTDPTTDLALLKIEGGAFPYVPFGESDDVEVGQWVLAVGNPFDLTSTVTAGIVSAKARNINILRQKSGGLSVESFIQTDAAVNPGNSGGALVDLKGNLVGINTAIATRTGSFSGYSFAVPADLVEKVVNDLKEYGAVQRALIGVSIMDINAELQKEKDLAGIEGVYVGGVNPHLGAAEAGIKEGDVILSVDDNSVNSVSELQELIARKRPGDKVVLKIRRGGDIESKSVMLKNANRNTDIVKAVDTEAEEVEMLNAEVRALTPNEKMQYGVDSGVLVTGLKEGKLAEAGAQAGFIITKVDREAINSAKDLDKALDGKQGGILLEGQYPNGEKAYYALGME